MRRRRSIAGPLILLLIGGLFLWNNLHPEYPVGNLLAQYWPFLLIGWGLVRLVEVLVWRSEADTRSFTGGEVVLVILLCIVGMGLYEGHRHGLRFTPRGIDMFGQQFDFPVSVRGSAEGAKRIVFENPRGNVRVTGGDGTDILINGRKLIRSYSRTEADRADSITPVEIIKQGDRILIRSNQEKVSGNLRLSTDLEVTVPRGMTVESRAVAGDYDVNDVTGDVELVTDRADVRLARIGGNARIQLGRSDIVRALDIKGNLDLEGRGSDVELENVAGQVTINGSYSGTLEFKNLAKPLHLESRNTELRVEALPGRISMDLGEFTAKNVVGPLKFTTKSRDIKIDDFTQSVELETDRGDIELQTSHLPMSQIDARSRMGRIDLVLPDKATFQLEATAEHGDAVNDFGPAIQRETEGRGATLRGSVGTGPRIHITTDRGSVAVRKAGSLPSASEHPDVPHPPRPPHPPRLPKDADQGLADSERKL